jgi:hypothetical protein
MLLSTNTKIDKSNNNIWKAKILQLAPYKISGYNVCPSASSACAAECLYYAGMGRFKNVQKSRVEKTKLFFEDRALFLSTLHKELDNFERKCTKEKLKAAVRLNGLSDILWEEIDPTIFSRHPNIQFWDYTKMMKRYRKFLSGSFPANYHLTFSRSESNINNINEIINGGGNFNIAVVFKNVPPTYNNIKVIDGDASDFRFLDPVNTIVGLKAKGLAKSDNSGFVL